MELIGCMGLGYGNSLGWVASNFLITRFEVEDGSKVSFWHDVWFGVLPLKGVFRSCFALPWNASVADHLQFTNSLSSVER
jgi:hypothetical protein